MSKKIILAIETSGKICSISLCRFDTEILDFANMMGGIEILAEYTIYEGNKHDKYCAELCKRILKDNNIDIEMISAVAVSIGPGSFTGLRIGGAIAKGLCFSTDIYNKNHLKLIAVPTLDALAFNAKMLLDSFKENNDFEILSIIPSHSNLVYYKFYDKKTMKVELISNHYNDTNIQLIKMEALTSMYSEKNNLFIATNYPIEINFGQYIPTLMKISSTFIASLASYMYKNNIFAEPIDLVPMYIQEFVPKNS